MKVTVGIRHEDKYNAERRVPLTPKHIKQLIGNSRLRFQVHSSAKRVFRDSEFETAGAEVVDNLQEASVIIGVKEIPLQGFEAGKTYMFFSHVIKGQSYNMPMLRKMMDLGCSLIDYEKFEDSTGRRLIFLGRYAGLAGMINTLWSLGQRLEIKGQQNPFTSIRQAHSYNSLEEAERDISEIGFEIASKGLPQELCPLVIGFTGYGNVSNGAQEICSLLPVMEITPEELLGLRRRKDLPNNLVYKVIFKEEDLSEPIDPDISFELMHYYKHPEQYKSKFERYIPHLNVLVNGMYWDARYPRIVTKDYLANLFAEEEPRLLVIGDITCDPDGSIECTHKGTAIEDPVFVYNPVTRIPAMGFKGDGVLVMAVDILPSELPREASIAFGRALMPFIEAIALADYDQDTDNLKLPDPVRRALILHKGKLTEPFRYIEKYL
jgi:alanine dehydrogenase